jgi:hypothetical protein
MLFARIKSQIESGSVHKPTHTGVFEIRHCIIKQEEGTSFFSCLWTILLHVAH